MCSISLINEYNTDKLAIVLTLELVKDSKLATHFNRGLTISVKMSPVHKISTYRTCRDVNVCYSIYKY